MSQMDAPVNKQEVHDAATKFMRRKCPMCHESRSLRLFWGKIRFAIYCLECDAISESYDPRKDWVESVMERAYQDLVEQHAAKTRFNRVKNMGCFLCHRKVAWEEFTEEVVHFYGDSSEDHFVSATCTNPSCEAYGDCALYSHDRCGAYKTAQSRMQTKAKRLALTLMERK